MRWLDASPIVGRTLIPADGEQGAERVVMLRESLWRRRYGADPNLIGRQVTIGGQPRTVVGVVPDLRWMLLISIPDVGIWMPATIFLALAIAGGLACWLPARRALHIRPAEALGTE